VTFPPKVKAPLLNGKSTGLFSTRTPHRPNPIGLTLAKLESVNKKKREVVVSGIDICDGTPVIDIKPYNPADMVDDPVFAKWIDLKSFSSGKERKTTDYPLEVKFSESATNEIRKHIQTKEVLEYFKSEKELCSAIEQVLRLDIRSVHQGRGTAYSKTNHCVVDNLRVEFVVSPDEEGNGKVATVVRILNCSNDDKLPAVFKADTHP